jgi:hypothetical protein
MNNPENAEKGFEEESRRRARCPHCENGRLVTLLVFERGEPIPDLARLIRTNDTS